MRHVATRIRPAAAAARVPALASALVLSLAAPGATQTVEWPSYAADQAGTKYSALDQINAETVGDVEIVWRQPVIPDAIRDGDATRGPLADVEEGDGGLCVVPGSHKANFPCPQAIREWEANQEIVYNVPAKAGDMIIFNEATIHGTLPWKNHERERRSLLVRYSPKYLHYAGGYYDVTFPEWADELTEAQRALLEPPYIYNRPLLEEDGETVVRPRVEY